MIQNGDISHDDDHSSVEGDPEYTLDTLRELLIGPTQLDVRDLQAQYLAILKQHAALYQRVDDLSTTWQDPEQITERMAESLAEAVLLREKTDSKKAHRVKFSTAIRPIIERTLQDSAIQNPKALIDSIFPVIMPAIRKALGHMLENLLQQINRTLEQRFSIQSIRWRIEAARTGKSYAEIVLAHTLDYRVEQVFLIHKETGLLLLHVASDPSQTQDADVISGMLTAIQDFTHDSFAATEDDELDTFQVGEHKVWVDHSPYAILATVIQGIPPLELRTHLQETLESIHSFHLTDLKQFDGDNNAFQVSQPILEQHLVTRYKRDRPTFSTEVERAEARKKRSWRLAFTVVILGLCTLLFFWIRNGIRWADYLDKLQAEPGLLVTSEDRFEVRGLQDPLAANPEQFLNCEAGGYFSSCRIDPADVRHAWEPYVAPVPSLTLRRATTLLQPTEGVALHIEGDTLRIAGPMSETWQSEAQRLGLTLPGISSVRAENHSTLMLDLTEQVESTQLIFAPGQATLDASQQDIIETLVSALTRLGDEAHRNGKHVQLEIGGHASADGTEATNIRISQTRAEQTRTALINAGLSTPPSSPDGIELVTRGYGSSQLQQTDRSAAEASTNRRVSFKITLVNS